MCSIKRHFIFMSFFSVMAFASVGASEKELLENRSHEVVNSSNETNQLITIKQMLEKQNNDYPNFIKVLKDKDAAYSKLEQAMNKLKKDKDKADMENAKLEGAANVLHAYGFLDSKNTAPYWAKHVIWSIGIFGLGFGVKAYLGERTVGNCLERCLELVEKIGNGDKTRGEGTSGSGNQKNT